MAPIRLTARLLAVTLLVLAFASRAAEAAPGDLDASFGGTGIVSTPIASPAYGAAEAVAVQPDGKVVVAGRRCADESCDFALLRYNTDGTPDTSFSGDGIQTTGFAQSSAAYAVATAPGGKIVVAGFSGGDFALARYTSDGELDPSFSGDGLQTTDPGGDSGTAQAVAVQPDGRIVVAGGSGGDFVLARYTNGGELDPTFSGDGLQTTDFGQHFEAAQGVAVQADGRIVAAGASGGDFALARYGSDGELDPSFSGDGLLTTDFGQPGESAQGVIVQPDGRIVAAGGSGDDFALARYTADGELDPTFSGDGVQTAAFGGRSAANDVAIDSGGRIVAAGNALTSDGEANEIALARYTSEGELDASFAGDGRQTIGERQGRAARPRSTPALGTPGAAGLAIGTDDKIVVAAGTAFGHTLSSYDVARFQGGGGDSAKRVRPKLSGRVRPERDKRKPFKFTAKGKLKLPGGVSRADGCSGTVKVKIQRIRKGRDKTGSSRRAKVRGDCTYTSTREFGRRRLKRPRGALKLVIRFQGNAVLKPVRIVRKVKFGRKR